MPASLSVYRASTPDTRAEAPLPTPTHHKEGTDGKKRVLAQRAAHGQQLFHPDDGQIPAPLPRPRRPCELQRTAQQRADDAARKRAQRERARVREQAKKGSRKGQRSLAPKG